jgi:glycerate dehydrogenase
MKTVFLDHASLDLGDLDLSGLHAATESLELYDVTQPADAAARIGDADCVIVNKVILDRECLQRCPRLKLILVVATGTNNVDLAAAAEFGITVSNCRGYGTASLAQHVLTLMLALARSLPAYQAAVARGDWSRSAFFCLLDYPIRQLDGRILGIIGHGELGAAAGRAAAALGMDVRIAEHRGAAACRPGRTPFEQILAESDVITVHCPLTPDTEGLIGEPELRRMRRDALLINTARGGVVDEFALARALREGWIAGAGVDVLSTEPPAADNPLLAGDIPNLIVTPHCAWGSREARQRIVEQTCENLEGFKRGQPVRVV